MSWVDKELKKRTAPKHPAASAPASPPSAWSRIEDLWGRLERANGALPVPLRLAADHGGPPPAAGAVASGAFVAWLRSTNGAALGLAGDGIRYVWPQVGRRRSNNFWIRWDSENARYSIHRRIGTSTPLLIGIYAFDDRRVEHIIKCLVTGKRVKVRAVRKKRMWLF